MADVVQMLYKCFVFAEYATYISFIVFTQSLGYVLFSTALHLRNPEGTTEHY